MSGAWLRIPLTHAFCSEVVSDDPGFEMLELRAFDLIEAVVVKDRDEDLEVL